METAMFISRRPTIVPVELQGIVRATLPRSGEQKTATLTHIQWDPTSSNCMVEPPAGPLRVHKEKYIRLAATNGPDKVRVI